MIEDRLQRIEKKIDKGNEAIGEVKDGLIITYEKLNDIHLSVLKTFSKEDAKEFARDLETFITTAFATLSDELSDDFKAQYKALKSTDVDELKLELGIPLLPLLGINAKYKVDVKKFTKRMEGKFPKQSLLFSNFNSAQL